MDVRKYDGHQPGQTAGQEGSALLEFFRGRRIRNAYASRGNSPQRQRPFGEVIYVGQKAQLI